MAFLQLPHFLRSSLAIRLRIRHNVHILRPIAHHFLFRDYQWACIEANEVPIYGNFYRKLLEKQVILEERIKELSDSGDTNEKDRLQKTLKDIKRQRLVKFNIIYIIIGVVFVLACILAPHILTMTYLGAILFTVLITGIIYFGSTPAVRFRT